MFLEPGLFDYQMLSKSIQSMSTLEFKTICYVMAQALFILFRTRAGKMLGIYKLLVLASFNVVILLLGNMIRNVDLILVLTDAPTLLGLQVLVDQIFKQRQKMEKDREEIADNSDDSDSELSDEEDQT